MPLAGGPSSGERHARPGVAGADQQGAWATVRGIAVAPQRDLRRTPPPMSKPRRSRPRATWWSDPQCVDDHRARHEEKDWNDRSARTRDGPKGPDRTHDLPSVEATERQQVEKPERQRHGSNYIGDVSDEGAADGGCQWLSNCRQPKEHVRRQVGRRSRCGIGDGLPRAEAAGVPAGHWAITDRAGTDVEVSPRRAHNR
jgi:hypothetical protein